MKYGEVITTGQLRRCY